MSLTTWIKKYRATAVTTVVVSSLVAVGCLSLRPDTTQPKDYVSLFVSFAALCISAGNAYLGYRDRNKDQRSEFYKQRNATLIQYTVNMAEMSNDFNFVAHGLQHADVDMIKARFPKLIEHREARDKMLASMILYANENYLTTAQTVLGLSRKLDPQMKDWLGQFPKGDMGVKPADVDQNVAQMLDAAGNLLVLTRRILGSDRLDREIASLLFTPESL